MKSSGNGKMKAATAYTDFTVCKVDTCFRDS